MDKFLSLWHTSLSFIHQISSLKESFNISKVSVAVCSIWDVKILFFNICHFQKKHNTVTIHMPFLHIDAYGTFKQTRSDSALTQHK